jgi:hypothetical protein
MIDLSLFRHPGSFGLVLAGLVAGLSASASAEMLHVRYGVSLLGLPLGTAGLEAKFDPANYSVEVTAKLSGLAALVSSSKGAATATGGLGGARVAPTTYATTSANAKETRTVRMAMNAGTVRGVEITPPFVDQPGRVPLSEADKRNILDPVSALVMPVASGQSLVGPSACNRTLPIFDGYTRFDVTLRFVGVRQIKSKSYSGPVSICAARYVPLAGHRPDRPGTKFMAENKDLETWLVPVESAHLVVPYRISVRTMLGTTIIEAQDLRIDGATGTRASVAQ